MIKIIFIAPTKGNGGIASWAANFRNKIPQDFELINVTVSKRRSQNVNASKIRRVVEGALDLIDVLKDVKQAIKDNPDAQILHLTISGNPGTIRDSKILKIAKRHGLKCIIQCHFGSVWSDIKLENYWGRLLRETLSMGDQIWVLDKKSLDALEELEETKGKAILNPNFLDVPEVNIEKNKTFKKVAFVGNLFPTKGVYDLVNAVSSMAGDTELHIVGPGMPNVVKTIESIAGPSLNDRIKLYGRLPNAEAVKLIEDMDIIALPTYYHGEAFPISILEAMSRGKMVISCDRGAIKDMLTSEDGCPCGLIVKPQDPNDIVKSIFWCQDHQAEANEMCKRAYQKVYDAYRTEIVMKNYTDCYKSLL